MTVQLRTDLMNFSSYNIYGEPFNSSMAIEAKYTDIN